MEGKFEKIWIDLREFGWGIREVPVIWPESHECKCNGQETSDIGQGCSEDTDDDEQPGGGFNEPMAEEEGD